MKNFLSLCAFILLAFFAKAAPDSIRIIATSMPPSYFMAQNTTNNIIGIYQLDYFYTTVPGNTITMTDLYTTINGLVTVGTTEFPAFHLYINTTPNIDGTETLLSTVTTWTVNTEFLWPAFSTTLADGGTYYLIITADADPAADNNDWIQVIQNDNTKFIFSTPAGIKPTTVQSGNQIFIGGPQVTIYSGSGGGAGYPTPGNILQGATLQTIASYKLVVGSQSDVTLDSLAFNTAGAYVMADFTQFQLWTSTTPDYDGVSPQIGGNAAPVGPGGTFVFSGLSLTLPAASTIYIVLTADVAANPTSIPGDNINITSPPNARFKFLVASGILSVLAPYSPLPPSGLQTIIGAGVSIDNGLGNPQASTIFQGATNASIYEFSIRSSGNANRFSGVTVTTAGGASPYVIGDLVATPFKLYYSPSPTYAGLVQLDVAQPAVGPGGNIAFAFFPLNIPPGFTRYFRITADIAAGATIGHQIYVINTPLSNFTFSLSPTVYGTDPCLAGGIQTIGTLSGSNEYWGTSPNTWDNNTTINWATSSGESAIFPWINGNPAWFDASIDRAGIATVGSGGVTTSQLNVTTNKYQIDASTGTAGVTFTAPANLSVSTGVLKVGHGNTNPFFYGTAGLNRLGAGELKIGSAFGSNFTGPITSTGGQFTLGTEDNSSDPSGFLSNATDISINNGTFNISGNSSQRVSLLRLNSLTFTGSCTMKMEIPTGGFSDFSFTNILFKPSISSIANYATFTAANAVPLNIGGQLVLKDTITGTAIITLTSQPDDRATFGSTTFTNATSLFITTTNNPFSLLGAFAFYRTVDHLSLGGDGDTSDAAVVPAGTIIDNGFPINFRDTTTSRSAGTASDAPWVSLNTSGTNTGNWTVGSGGDASFYLLVNNAGALTTGRITVNRNGSLRLYGNTAGAVNYSTTGSPIYLTGTGTQITNASVLNLNGALWLENHNSGATNNSLAKDIVLNSSDATITSYAHGTTGANAKWTLSGAITGTGGLTKNGKATLILSGANSGTWSTTVNTDTLRVESGSALGTGALTMSQLSGYNTQLILKNAAQTVGNLSSVFANASGQNQTITLNNTNLTVNQTSTTTYGNNNIGSSTGIIAGAGNLIKDGAGTLILTGMNTFGGLTQVKAGTLQLNCTSGSTLLATDSVHIIGGTLQVSQNQTLSNLTLSGGTLIVDAFETLTITGNFTYASGTIINNGTITYSGASSTLIYAGNVPQTAANDANEWPRAITTPPTNIIINNYSISPEGSLGAVNVVSGLGVTLPTAVIILATGGTVTVNGWLNLGDSKVGGTATTFNLKGLNGSTITGDVTSGSKIITSISSASGVWIGMKVIGTGIPSGTYITYIDPLNSNAVWISNNATATNSGVSLTMQTRGGVRTSADGGLDANVSAAILPNFTSKNYSPGANFYFTGSNAMSPAFPAAANITSGTYSPAWDVAMGPLFAATSTCTFAAPGTNIAIDDTLFMLGGRLNINGINLTLNGYITTPLASSDITGGPTSSITVGGTTSDNLGTLNFTTAIGSGTLLNNFTMNRTTTDVTSTLASRATLGTDLTVGGAGLGTFTFTNGDFDLNGNTLTLNGTLAGSGGAFMGSATSGLYVSGSAGGDLGNSTATIRFKPTFQTLNLLTMNRSGGALASATVGRAALGTSLTANAITLTNGVLATGSNTNLLTWNRTGALTQPQPTWVASDALYRNSYIATCDAAGNTIAPAPPLPIINYDGSYGFRVLNIGGGTTVYFPVGHSYLKTPNRMMIQNTGTTTDITVVIGTGDLLQTPQSRINRIWYVNSSVTSGITANMRLFFTKRDWTAQPYPGTQDEVETGFTSAIPRIVQKDYNNIFRNISSLIPIDYTDFSSNATYPLLTEIYGQYTIGVSPNSSLPTHHTNGMEIFTRFSVVNDAGGIVLPVNIISLNAYQKGEAVKVDWTSLNELNVDHYEVQRSATGSGFVMLGSVKALDNGQPLIDYSFTDMLPLSGDNFYRIKAVDKNGEVTYTNVVKVNIGGIRTGFAVYPNPVTSHQLTVQISNLPQGKYLLQLYNVLGQQIMNKTIEHDGGSSVQTITLPMNARAGIYMLRITNGKASFTQSLVVE